MRRRGPRASSRLALSSTGGKGRHPERPRVRRRRQRRPFGRLLTPPLRLAKGSTSISDPLKEPGTVAKPELGTKRLCTNCSAKFYDLNKDPIVCPKCHTVMEL